MDAMSLPFSLRPAPCRRHAATRRQATRDRIIRGLAWARQDRATRSSGTLAVALDGSPHSFPRAAW